MMESSFVVCRLAVRGAPFVLSPPRVSRFSTRAASNARRVRIFWGKEARNKRQRRAAAVKEPLISASSVRSCTRIRTVEGLQTGVIRIRAINHPAGLHYTYTMCARNKRAG